MNAGLAGEKIAKFIDRSWPNDKKEIFNILRLGINKAWQQGKWIGMTAEFEVKIQKDSFGQNYIIAPPTHPILLAINVDGKPRTLRDKYFMFHRNGDGHIRNRKGCKWNQQVYDLGAVPVFNKNNINFCKGVTIGVRSIGPAGPNEKIVISGSYEDGKKIYTYEAGNFGKACGCESSEETVETVSGVSLDINQNFNYISNIQFTDISNIYKTVTRSPIEVIALTDDGNGYSIARLEPNQRFSKYRKYLIPDDICNQESVHGLFKISQQEEIVSLSDPLMISNEEALICFSKGIHQMYYKDQTELGAQFILQGIAILEKEKQEEESPTSFGIQVECLGVDDLPNILRYQS